MGGRGCRRRVNKRRLPFRILRPTSYAHARLVAIARGRRREAEAEAAAIRVGLAVQDDRANQTRCHCCFFL